MNTRSYSSRQRAAIPFAVVAGLAIVVGGVIAAAVAHDPTQPLVWMVAYLVLVVGVAQLALGAGQAYLAKEAPTVSRAVLEWTLFNLGNAGVIAGTLHECVAGVTAGTLLLVIALALFIYGIRGTRGHGLLQAYRVLLAVIFIGAVVGVTLSAVQAYA